MKLVLLGAPGAGKGTQAEILSRTLNIPTISTGNILRAAMKNGTPVGLKAKEFVESGKLVPDEVIIGIVQERLAEPDCANGYILDGMPRTIPQAEALTFALKSQKTKIDFAIDVEVPDESIVQRMSGRRVCPGCGATYHIKYNPPVQEGICDECGAQLIQRDDDKAETVQKRLDVYHAKTQPLIAYYKEQGCMYSVDGTRTMEDVFSDIQKILKG
jgi:adenylate kinase